jgi:hypothetical protein
VYQYGGVVGAIMASLAAIGAPAVTGGYSALRQSKSVARDKMGGGEIERLGDK